MPEFNKIPRPEHPEPIFMREDWINLNGNWMFEFDFGQSGRERKMYDTDNDTMKKYTKTIIVPFCPESKKSGIEYTDFINAVWYKKKVFLSDSQIRNRVLLHFGAVDYESHIYVNGQFAGKHVGGYTSFHFDITELCVPGENDITVNAIDDLRSKKQPRGKQCPGYYSSGCDYTRTTGIWQTVWLEFVPDHYIESVKYYPDITQGLINIDANIHGAGELTIFAFYEGKSCGSIHRSVHRGLNRLTLTPDEIHLWEAGCGRLYDLELHLSNENTEDIVKSYCALREVSIDGYKFLLNRKTIFLRTVLDQGFYRDGIYTAPSDEDLISDIKLSMEMGFNGARLHQKIFEPRFLYHCDKAGYLVWGEHGNWGLDLSSPEAFLNFMPEWAESVQRDFNHPSIIGWCPFNETWDTDGKRQHDFILESVYKLTKNIDPTRPCIDTSGNFHVLTDIYDLHNYNQNVKEFSDCYSEFAKGGEFKEEHPDRQHYTKGLPLFISEYGGIKWDLEKNSTNGWGYGEAPSSEEEFLTRYEGLTTCLLDNPNIMGFCYTQLYDIEQEINGLYTYDRQAKFDSEIIKRINMKEAAIEKL